MTAIDAAFASGLAVERLRVLSLVDEAIKHETDDVAISGLVRLKNAIANAQTELPLCMGVPDDTA